MNEEKLRDEIYKRLGVEKGSLASESGNDWQRAKNEILEEWKQQEQQKINTENKIDYVTLNKDTNLFQTLLKDSAHNTQYFKSIIATRDDLNENEMQLLIETGSKEVLINLAKQPTLPSTIIDAIIVDGVYMAKKYLIEYQELSADQKNTLLSLMKLHPDTYKNELLQLERISSNQNIII